jgi:hypothetical protein
MRSARHRRIAPPEPSRARGGRRAPQSGKNAPGCGLARARAEGAETRELFVPSAVDGFIRMRLPRIDPVQKSSLRAERTRSSWAHTPPDSPGA